MTGNHAPEPAPQGELGPPRRLPPTAVGADTLPPPRGRPGDFLSTFPRHTLGQAIALTVVVGLLILVLWSVVPTILPTILAGLVGSVLGLAVIHRYQDRLSFIVALSPLILAGVAGAAAAVRFAPPGFTHDTSPLAQKLLAGVSIGVLVALSISLLTLAWLLAWSVRRDQRAQMRRSGSARRGA